MIVIWGIDNDENEENEDDPLARRSEQDRIGWRMMIDGGFDDRDLKIMPEKKARKKGGGSPELSCHDCSGAASQVAPQGRRLTSSAMAIAGTSATKARTALVPANNNRCIII